MGSQELKLLLTTCNFWLLSPSSSSELWLLSLATAITGTGMEDTEEGTEAMAAMAMATMATTARGPLMLSLRLRLMLSPPPLLSPAMVTTDMATDTALTDMGTLLLTPMDITVTTARDLPMLSPAMVTTDTVTDTVLTDTAAMDMEDTEVTTTARDLPMLSPAMVTMVMVMEDTEEVITVTAMVMVMGTTVEKIQKFMLIQSE